MVDDLLKESEVKYRRAKQYLAAGSSERALIDYHEALEKLLRWCLVRDGADYARAADPQQVTWQDLITYLDVRYAVPRQLCAFLSQMTYLYTQVVQGHHPELPALTMQSYQQQVTQLFHRFYPRDIREREEVAMRGTFGRRRAPDELTVWPAERAQDTRVVVPVPPPPDQAPALGMAPAARAAEPAAPARVDQLPRPSALPPPAAAPPPPAAAPPPASFPPAAALPGNTGAPGGAAPLAFAPGNPVVPVMPTPTGSFGGAGGSPLAPPPTSPSVGDRIVSPDTFLAPADHGEARDADAQRQRAIAAGQRLREMRMNGLDFCPRCRETIPLTSAVCPYCHFDLDAYRAQQTAGRPAPNTVFDRFLGRRRPTS